jgi:hypothetical protein
VTDEKIAAKQIDAPAASPAPRPTAPAPVVASAKSESTPAAPVLTGE